MDFKYLKFKKESVNCNVKVEKEIHSEYGKIISGDVQAGFAIDVYQIGHEESAAAKIVVGSKRGLADKKKALEEKIKEHSDRFKEIKGQMYDLFKRQIKKMLSEPDEEKLKEMQTFKSEARNLLKTWRKN